MKDGRANKKDERGIKKQSNQRPFERFRMVMKMAVSSSASLRSSPTFAAGTMLGATATQSARARTN
jgi:hypothetical protein